jgi:hypothetical protein
MSVCRESYRVVSHLYVKAFGSRRPEAFTKTWFNFDLDTLYLDWATGVWDIESDKVEDISDLANVQNLVIFQDAN